MAYSLAPVAASAYGLTSVPLWGEVAWPKEVFIHITPLKLYVPTEGRTASAYGLAPIPLGLTPTRCRLGLRPRTPQPMSSTLRTCCISAYGLTPVPLGGEGGGLGLKWRLCT